jgi:hypothetical protein
VATGGRSANSITGNLNNSSVAGSGGLLRINAGTYTINQPLAVAGNATLNLKARGPLATSTPAAGHL